MSRFAVIFDMDGVLVDSRTAHLQSWQLLGEETGHHVSEAEFDKGFGRTSREVLRESFGVVDDATIHRLDLRKEAIYRDIIRGNIPAMPGADDLINRLYAIKIPLAVGSSGPPENVMLVCDTMGWTSKFKAIVTGADVTKGKPDPQVFLIAAERLGLTPADCVVIEDAPAGILAAHAAGMQAVALLSSYPRDALARADLLIDNLSEFDLALIATHRVV